MKLYHAILAVALLCLNGVSFANTSDFPELNYQFNKSTMIKEKLKKAQECINKGDYTAAKNYLNGVLKLDPNNAKAKELLAACNKGGKPVTSSRPNNNSSNSNTSNRGTSSYTALSVSKANLSFGSYGGTETIIVSGSSWSISVYPASWGHLTRSGNILTLKIDANSSTSSRTDYFKLKSESQEIQVNVSQSGSSHSSTFPHYSLSTTNVGIAKKRCEKHRFTFGWNTFHIDYMNDVMTAGTGVRFRVGDWRDAVNLLFGAEYSCILYFDSESDYFYKKPVQTETQAIEIPVGLRFNLFKTGKRSKFYMGCNGAFGFNFLDGRDFDINKRTISIDPQLGFASKHVDFGIYFKCYLKNYGIFTNTKAHDQRYGCFMTWYI